MKLKQINIVAAFLVAVFSFSSCQKKETAESLGKLSLSFSVSDKTTDFKPGLNSVKDSFSTKALEDKVFKVTIQNKKSGDIVNSWDNHNDIPSEITLDAGAYIVTASTSNIGSLSTFDDPIYSGSSEVVVVGGTVKSCAIVCKLAAIKVAVTFTENIVKNFISYDAKITSDIDGATLQFEDSDNRTGYIKANEKVFLSLKVVNNNGVENTLPVHSIEVEPQGFYTLNFDINPNPSSPNSGAGFITLRVDTATNDYEIGSVLPLRKSPLPEITGSDFNISAEVAVFEGETISSKANLDVKAGISFVTLELKSDFFTSAMGLPYEINLIEASAEVKQQLRDIGIDFPEIIQGELLSWIDFTELTKNLPSTEQGELIHEINIIVRDLEFQETRQKISFKILPKGEIATVSINPWAKFVYVWGLAPMTDINAELERSFEYREKGTAAWKSVTEDMPVTVEGDTFYCKITGLKPSTDYEVRATLGASAANTVYFTTEAATQLPNIGFDLWHYSGTHYPNESGGNSWWATGNEGTKMVSYHATVPSDDTRRNTGKSARLESRFLSGIANTFAAGSLFAGTFRMSGFSPVMTSGRPYTGRPTKLSFWYKYSPVAISHASGSYGGLKGQMDKCHVYIRLLNSQRKPIAFGEFKTDQKVEEYAHYTIELEYYDQVTPVSEVELTITSSYMGEFFTGGSGSILFVDDMELLFD